MTLTQRMEKTMYKLNIQGIVYLVDPATSKAYTYDLSTVPSGQTEIGKIVWTDPKDDPRIDLLPSWMSILQAKLEAHRSNVPTLGYECDPK